MIEKDVILWKVESVTLIFIVVCVSLSLYLTFLSVQIFDDNLSKQLVAFAVFFLVTGIVIFAALTVHLGIKKVVSRTEDVVKK